MMPPKGTGKGKSSNLDLTTTDTPPLSTTESTSTTPPLAPIFRTVQTSQGSTHSERHEADTSGIPAAEEDLLAQLASAVPLITQSSEPIDTQQKHKVGQSSNISLLEKTLEVISSFFNRLVDMNRSIDTRFTAMESRSKIPLHPLPLRPHHPQPTSPPLLERITSLEK